MVSKEVNKIAGYLLVNLAIYIDVMGYDPAHTDWTMRPLGRSGTANLSASMGSSSNESATCERLC